MKRTIFESLRLSAQEQQYAKHYIQTHFRLAMVVIIVLCLFVLGLLLPESLIMLPLSFFTGSISGIADEEGLPLFFISICILAYVLPLFQFRFLMQRSGSDLYLSLPMERKRLFYVHYGIGLVFLVTCALVELLVMICFAGPSGNGLNELELNGRFVCGVYILLGICLYTFFVALVMHCHRILDGMLICIIYTILPVLIYYSLQLFLYHAQNSVMFADSFVSYNTVEDAAASHDMIFMFASLLSIPWQMNSWLDVAYGSFGDSLSFLAAALIAWMIVAVLCYLHARDKMVRMRSELSGQPTQSLLTYPLLIPVLALLFVMAFGNGSIISFPILMILVIYLFAYCFAKRKLTFDVRTLLVYMAIVLISSGLYHLIGKNHWFQTIHEFPTADGIEYMQIEVCVRSDITEFHYKMTDAISDPVAIKSLIQDQEALAKRHEKIPTHESWDTTVTFYYHENGKVTVLNYTYNKDMAKQEAVDEMLAKWQKQKLLQEPEYEDSRAADIG